MSGDVTAWAAVAEGFASLAITGTLGVLGWRVQKRDRDEHRTALRAETDARLQEPHNRRIALLRSALDEVKVNREKLNLSSQAPALGAPWPLLGDAAITAVSLEVASSDPAAEVLIRARVAIDRYNELAPDGFGAGSTLLGSVPPLLSVIPSVRESLAAAELHLGNLLSSVQGDPNN